MKSRLLTFSTALALSAAACKEPAVTGADTATFPVTGTLSYRSACLDGTPAPFPGVADEGGPLVYLTNSSGVRVSAFARPNAAGRFSIAAVSGDHRLHVVAGRLQHLWFGEAVPSLGVSVGEAGVELGTVCADTVPVTGLRLTAQWAGEHSDAAPDGTLHVPFEAAVAYAAEGDTVVGHATLVTVSDNRGSALGEGGLRIRAGDGYGSFVNLEASVRGYANQAAAKRFGGWMRFGAEVTSADLTLSEGWQVGVAGLAGLAPAGGTTPVRATLAATFPARESLFAVPVTLTSIGVNGSVEFGISESEGAGLAVRLTHTEDGYELALVDALGGVIASEPRTPCAEILLRLEVDYANGLVRAGTNGSGGASLTAALPAWANSRVAPYLQLRGGDEAATAVDVYAVYSRAQAWKVVLPLAAGELDGVTYDQTPYGAGQAILIVGGVERVIEAGTSEVMFDRPVALSRALFDVEGYKVTLFTDLAYETVTAPGFSDYAVLDWRQDVVAAVSDGDLYLY